jgi:hypothetical protein
VTAAERARIVEGLQDETRSYRSLSHELGVSDWLIRKVARQVYADPRPMKRRRSRSAEIPAEEVSAATSWLVVVGILAAVVLLIWAGVRWAPPLEYREFPPGFYPDSSPEREDNETQFPE